MGNNFLIPTLAQAQASIRIAKRDIEKRFAVQAKGNEGLLSAADIQHNEVLLRDAMEYIQEAKYTLCFVETTIAFSVASTDEEKDTILMASGLPYSVNNDGTNELGSYNPKLDAQNWYRLHATSN
jgi:hypothetical protein